MLVEAGRASIAGESIGQLEPVAAHAVELFAQLCAPLLVAQDPGSIGEGRVMPDMLAVSAAQHSERIALGVETEVDDGSMHDKRPRRKTRCARQGRDVSVRIPEVRVLR